VSNTARHLAALVACLLVVAVPAAAKLIRSDLAQSVLFSYLTAEPTVQYTTTSTTPAEALATADQSYSGIVRAKVENLGSVDVCVSWSGAVGTACSTGGNDCDGDNDDGVHVPASGTYSPPYDSRDLGRLCIAAASGTPSVRTTYDTH